MSIFGKLDAETIPTNPFWVEKGEYDGEITDAKYQNNRDGERQLIITYTIDDADSQFQDSKVNQYFTLVDPEMTLETFSNLPADDQKKIRKNNSALKRTLCGDDRNKGLGIAADDLNDENWNPEVLKGLKVHFAVYNYGSKDEGVGVRWANLRD